MKTTDIIKNLSKMNASELRMICREMNCKVGSKKEMLTRLVAPLLQGKHKFKMESTHPIQLSKHECKNDDVLTLEPFDETDEVVRLNILNDDETIDYWCLAKDFIKHYCSQAMIDNPPYCEWKGAHNDSGHGGRCGNFKLLQIPSRGGETWMITVQLGRQLLEAANSPGSLEVEVKKIKQVAVGATHNRAGGASTSHGNTKHWVWGCRRTHNGEPAEPPPPPPQSRAAPPAASAAAQTTGSSEFSVHFTGSALYRTYTFTVTSATSLKQLYQMLERETSIRPINMQFSVNRQRLPRIEDDGVQRPLRDFNIFSETTIHLTLRFGGIPRTAPYRREDWFQPAAASAAESLEHMAAERTRHLPSGFSNHILSGMQQDPLFQPPAAASAAAQTTGSSEFSVHIRTLTGRTYTFTVTPATSFKQLYQMMKREANISPMEMQFILNRKRLPRIEDDGVQRPLRDFNIFSETTIHLLLRLGGSPQPAPYRREDWFH